MKKAGYAAGLDGTGALMGKIYKKIPRERQRRDADEILAMLDGMIRLRPFAAICWIADMTPGGRLGARRDDRAEEPLPG